MTITQFQEAAANSLANKPDGFSLVVKQTRYTKFTLNGTPLYEFAVATPDGDVERDALDCAALAVIFTHDTVGAFDQ